MGGSPNWCPSCSQSKNEPTNPKSRTQDFRDFLLKKWQKSQVTHCHYEQLIIAVLSHCHYMSYSRPSVFSRLNLSPIQS